MPEELRARFECRKVAHHSDGTERVKLTPVYSQEEGHPNKKFWEASPSGTFELTITEEGGQGFFEPGKEYDFTITEREG